MTLRLSMDNLLEENLRIEKLIAEQTEEKNMALIFYQIR